VGGGGVFLERDEIVRRGAELDAEIEHEIVDRARGLKVAAIAMGFVPLNPSWFCHGRYFWMVRHIHLDDFLSPAVMARCDDQRQS
jgi:hypothetical protein